MLRRFAVIVGLNAQFLLTPCLQSQETLVRELKLVKKRHFLLIIRLIYYITLSFVICHFIFMINFTLFHYNLFTTAELESPSSFIRKPSNHSFLFSVNEGSKYPITSGDTTAIRCLSGGCAIFGCSQLVIASDSNNNTRSWCEANGDSYILPAAKGSEEPSINGGNHNFKVK